MKRKKYRAFFVCVCEMENFGTAEHLQIADVSGGKNNLDSTNNNFFMKEKLRKIVYLVLCVFCTTHLLAKTPPKLTNFLGIYEITANDLFVNYPDWDKYNKKGKWINVYETKDKKIYYLTTGTDLKGFFPATIMKDIQPITKSKIRRKGLQNEWKKCVVKSSAPVYYIDVIGDGSYKNDRLNKGDTVWAFSNSYRDSILQIEAVNIYYITNNSCKAGFINTENITQEKTWLAPLLWSILAFLFICYIIALVRVRTSSMVVFVNWYDFFLMIAALIIGVIGFLFFETETYKIIVWIVSGLAFLGSLIWTIIANKNNVFDMIVAVFAKIFATSIFWIIFLYVFRSKKETTTERIDNQSYQRYLTREEQQLEDAKHSRNSKIAIGIAGFLIFSLVGNGRSKDIINKLKSKV